MHDSALPFICFTDDPTLTSATWQLVVVEPRMPRDLTCSARALKIVGRARARRSVLLRGGSGSSSWRSGRVVRRLRGRG